MGAMVRAGPPCDNHRMVPSFWPESVVVRSSPVAGRGLFAAAPFAAWQPILAVDDSDVVTPDRPLRPELQEFEYYCDMVGGRTVIMLKEPIRYVNHSCDPNAFCRIIEGVRCLVARRTIAAGEEICTDYNVNSAIDGFAMPCRCGSARCRGTVTENFFDLPSALQREYLPLLDAWFREENADRLRGLR